jgi:hypothetical protein
MCPVLKEEKRQRTIFADFDKLLLSVSSRYKHTRRWRRRCSSVLVTDALVISPRSHCTITLRCERMVLWVTAWVNQSRDNWRILCCSYEWVFVPPRAFPLLSHSMFSLYIDGIRPIPRPQKLEYKNSLMRCVILQAKTKNAGHVGQWYVI